MLSDSIGEYLVDAANQRVRVGDVVLAIRQNKGDVGVVDSFTPRGCRVRVQGCEDMLLVYMPQYVVKIENQSGVQDV